jgi:predicted NBD/HSP70 family sugar kinase
VSAGVDAVVDAIAAEITGMMHAYGAHHRDGGYDISAAGVICPGSVDAEAGIARYSANIGWRDLPLRARLAATTGLAIGLDHDVTAAGIAEFSLGAGRGVAEALYLQIGTGIAGAILSDARVVRGSDGGAGEIGHIPVMPCGERCNCGQFGCTEAYASAAGLARRYRAATRHAPGSTAEAGDQDVSAEKVIARAMAGDAMAAAVWDDGLTALSRALAGYCMLLEPELIVVGGGLSRAGNALIGPLGRRLADALSWRKAPRLVIGDFVADAGRLGGALVGWRAAAQQARVRQSPAQVCP